MREYPFHGARALSLAAGLALSACGGDDDAPPAPDLPGKVAISATVSELKAPFDVPQLLQLTVKNTGPVAVTDLLPQVSGIAVAEVGNTCKGIVLDTVAHCTLSYLVKPEAPGQGALALDLQFSDAGVVRHASLRIPYDFAASQWEAVPAWGNNQGNAAHNGYVPVSLNVERFKLAWASTEATTTRIVGFSSDKDTIYFTAWQDDAPTELLPSWVQAVSMADGSVRWRRELGSRLPRFDAPAVMDGDLFVAFSRAIDTTSDNNWSWKLDAKTGEIKAQTRLDDYGVIGHMLPVIQDRTVYYFLKTDSDRTSIRRGRVLTHNRDSGQPSWSDDYPASDGLTPAVDAKYVYAYLGSDTKVGGRLQAIDRESGNNAFEIPDPNFRKQDDGDFFKPSLVLDERSAYAFALVGDRMVAFDLARHEIAWQGLDFRRFSGQPAYADQTLFAVTADGRALKALNAQTGAVLWTWLAPEATSTNGNILTSNTIVTKTHVFVATKDATYAINRTSHWAQWSHPAGGPLMISNAGTLVISGANGLTVISLR